jgi:hypothetical protein
MVEAGGLGLFWNNNITVDVSGYSKYHIDVSVLGIGETQWRLTSVYGEARNSEKYRTGTCRRI